MTGFVPDKDRKVIPRWRTFDATLRMGELDSVVPPSAHETAVVDFLASKRAEWQRHGTPGHAADFVGAAIALGRGNEATKAAKFLLRNDISTSDWVRELAKQAVRQNDEGRSVLILPQKQETSSLHAQVRAFRQLLRVEPRDPITWVDLSRVYVVLGLPDQAARSMSIAVQLAGDNRFVLRSASRLWIHLGDLERAHAIIARTERTQHDPWLLAAEIAIRSAAGKTPRFTKAAMRVLNDTGLGATHLSELASAIATLELSAGRIKKMRTFFAKSLESPTENSVAQAAWAARQNRGIRFDDRYLDVPNTFEARSWTYFQQSRWNTVVDECWLWQFDQPFSSRPGIHGSYVAAIALQDYQASESFALQGLVSNATDFILQNNLAFARINLGNTSGAAEVLGRIDETQLSEHNRVVLIATKGLLAYRTGQFARGRELYAEAIDGARKVQDRQLLALAFVFYAMEEVAQLHSGVDAVVTEALETLRRVDDPSVKLLRDRLVRTVSQRAADVSGYGGMEVQIARPIRCVASIVRGPR